MQDAVNEAQASMIATLQQSAAQPKPTFFDGLVQSADAGLNVGVTIGVAAVVVVGAMALASYIPKRA